MNHITRFIFHNARVPTYMLQYRSMAKNKDRKKEKLTDRPKVFLDDDEMEKLIRYQDFKMSTAILIDELKTDLKLNYNIRFNPLLIENLEIVYDDVKANLGDLATVVRKQNDLILNLSSSPNAVKAAITAINRSGLNLNPQSDGHIIYMKLPRITSEHREDLIKSVKSVGNATKDHIRNNSFQKKFYIKDGQKKISQELLSEIRSNLNYFIRNKCEEIDEIVKHKIDSLSHG
ncbi:hypothetical protein NH340_JMT01185 [Sarcoptes scabiei]|nr:hypothetical protein NH340_JMT01185 [Sarcoptes scabiei]